MLSFINARNENQPARKIEDTIRSIQQGNFSMREQFILDYKPFILKCTTKFTNNYVNTESSDEFSIALIAFNEAINAFKLVKGIGFLTFSEIVIKNRLTDNARKNTNQKNVLPFVSLETRNEEGKLEPYDVAQDDPSFVRIEIKDEIQSLSLTLMDYGILFNDLVRYSPKHVDFRLRLISLAKVLHGNEIMLNKLKRTKSIPIRELLEFTSVCRGTIEQNRKYIIALVLILDSKLDVLKSYVDCTTRGGVQYAD